MKLLRTAAMAGIAKKVYDEARKPHNQQKIREAYASFQARRGGQQTPPGRPGDTPPATKPPTGPR